MHFYNKKKDFTLLIEKCIFIIKKKDFTLFILSFTWLDKVHDSVQKKKASLKRRTNSNLKNCYRMQTQQKTLPSRLPYYATSGNFLGRRSAAICKFCRLPSVFFTNLRQSANLQTAIFF
jgi:hypothetical protein